MGRFYQERHPHFGAPGQQHLMDALGQASAVPRPRPTPRRLLARTERRAPAVGRTVSRRSTGQRTGRRTPIGVEGDQSGPDVGGTGRGCIG
jgi:hypothetical protein